MAENISVALAHFNAIPWCAAFIANPSYRLTHMESRLRKASGEDALFAETFHTSTTIPHCLALALLPTSPKPGQQQRIEEIAMLLQLERKINGHPTIAHGGAQAFLLDEAMAKLLSVNKDLSTDIGAANRPVTVTKSLSVEFVRPMTTPAAVLAVARFDGEQQGRRFAVAAEVRDGKGEVLTRGNAVFVQLRGEGESKI